MCVFFYVKNYFAVNQISSMDDEKFLKKVLAGKEKGCTFAPAFPEGEGPEGAEGRRSSLKA